MIKTITISVTQKDIDVGISGDCFHCPVARAIARRIKRGFVVTVAPDYIDILKPNFSLLTDTFLDQQAYSVKAPLKVEDFIDQFDNHLQPSAIRFKLDLPDWVLK